jgi:DNA primase
MENNWVDFKAIKAAVSLQAVLDRYGVNWLRKNGDELRGRCPIHKGEGKDTFHASLVKGVFHCFSCKKRGNVLDFVAAMETCSVRDAGLKLQEWFMVAALPAESAGNKKTAATKAVVASAENRTRESESGGVELVNKPLTFQLKGIDPAHPYLAARGISRETLEVFGVGYFPGKGSMAGRVVIPIHNESGELVAYAGRAIDGAEPKYKFPAGFHKSLVLYNLNSALEQDSTGAVVVVEGFFDCMKVSQTVHVCVALMGSSLSKEQEELLCRHFRQAVLMFDADEAGQSCGEDCLKRLSRRMWVRTAIVPEGKQPDQLTDEEIRGVLAPL